MLYVKIIVLRDALCFLALLAIMVCRPALTGANSHGLPEPIEYEICMGLV